MHRKTEKYHTKWTQLYYETLSLKITALNAGGLCESDKRTVLFRKLKAGNPDIIILVETKLNAISQRHQVTAAGGDCDWQTWAGHREAFASKNLVSFLQNYSKLTF